MVQTYNVIPGRSVGIFQLGDSLWHVLDLLRTDKTVYPKVEVSWDPDTPHKSAITIHLPHIALYFPYPSQTLQQILLPYLPTSKDTLNLTYEGEQTLSSSSLPLTRARVGKILGPTYGSGDKLVYPGIAFGFEGGERGREDVVKTLKVVRKVDVEVASLSAVLSVVIQPGRGISLQLPDGPLVIKLGETTAQDILLDLGSPLRVYYKEDDRVEKMWGGPGGVVDTLDGGVGSCFWNYFQYGLDILVSSTGIASKIVLHSNIPGTPLFQRYAKCLWSLPLTNSPTSSPLNSSSPLSAFRSNLTTIAKAEYIDEVRLTVPNTSTTKAKKAGKRSGSPSTGIGAVERNDEVQGDAMVLDRVGEGGFEGVVGMGSSRLVGFDGLIVEEDQTSGGICSVLVWRDGRSDK